MRRLFSAAIAATALAVCNNGVDPSAVVTKEAVTGHWTARIDVPVYLDLFLGYQKKGNDQYFLHRHQYFNADGFFREEWSGKHVELINGIPRTERFFVFLSDTGRWNFIDGSVAIERQKCNNPIRGSEGESVPCGCDEYGRKQTDTVEAKLFNGRTWVRMETIYGPLVEIRWWLMP